MRGSRGRGNQPKALRNIGTLPRRENVEGEASCLVRTNATYGHHTDIIRVLRCTTKIVTSESVGMLTCPTACSGSEKNEGDQRVARDSISNKEYGGCESGKSLTRDPAEHRQPTNTAAPDRRVEEVERSCHLETDEPRSHERRPIHR